MSHSSTHTRTHTHKSLALQVKLEAERQDTSTAPQFMGHQPEVNGTIANQKRIPDSSKMKG